MYNYQYFTRLAKGNSLTKIDRRKNRGRGGEVNR